MKQILNIAFCFLLATSCKKQEILEKNENTFVSKLNENLKANLNADDYALIDFSKLVLHKLGKDTQYLMVGFKEKHFSQNFLLLQLNKDGNISSGKFVQLERTKSDKPYQYNGKVIIENLHHKILLTSTITNGYLDVRLKSNPATREATLIGPEYLEPVIVIAYRKDERMGFSYSTMFNLNYMSYADYSTQDIGVQYYITLNGYYYNGAGRQYEYNGGALSGADIRRYYEEEIVQQAAEQIDIDLYAEKPAIEIDKYLKCFNLIPDEGATCTVEIFADIPIDSDPNKLLNWQTGSPGHTFISITKSNGSQRVSQNIGFYPSEGWKISLSNAPVDGKFVDNSKHEFNASLKMNINTAQLQSALTEIQYLARFIKYDIDEYNCTDFAMDVFNKARSYPLKIPMYDIPGGMTAGGTRTPQGLYNKLKQMKDANDPESKNIIVDIYKGWVGESTGPCN